MSLKMAVNALQTLSKNHIWVLKATWKKEKLHDKVKSDSVWALKTTIKSFVNSTDLKKIKAELVPSVLTEDEWKNWGAGARDILKTDPSFGLSPENADIYSVRERPISVEEKLYNEFKAAKNFFDRVQTVRNYAAQKDTELDTEYFAEMFAYFSGYLKSYNQVNEQVVVSYLIIKDLVEKFPHLDTGIKINFRDLFDEIPDKAELFLNLKDPRLKEEFLRQIRLYIPGWAEIFIDLFPRYPHHSIIQSLEKEEEKLRAMALNCFENLRDNKEAVVWLFKNSAQAPWFKKAEIPFEKQLITLIHVLDISYREIENRRDTSENRKLNKQVYTILFSEELINNFIDSADQETIVRIYTFINDVKDLDPADKMNLKTRIIKKYPDFKFFGAEEKKVSTLGLIVTLSKFQEKQKQFAHIIEVDIPANSREIEAAKQHGDLKENAEYHAAREKQTQLNSLASRLSGEIDRAQIFDPSLVNTSKVSFGTRAALLDKNSGNREEFTILGPWESDPDNRIISYLSPFGSAILNKAPGDEVVFSSNEETVSYVLEGISSVF
jgi:transcription elongation factor GreA